MKDKDDIKILLDNFQKLENRPIQYDEDAIVSAYQKDNEGQSLPIKILSIFGGILASLAFLGFLMITGLYNSGVGLLVTGGLLIAGSILSIKVNDSIIIDTLRVSSYIIGFTLIGFGCEQLKLDENIISIIFIIIALSSLIITQNYILSFVSVIIINGSILALVLRNNAFNFIPIYISILALVMTYFFLKEANIITKSKVLSELYNPVKTGLIFSFLIALVFLGKKGIVTISLGYILYSSGILILAIVYLISILFNVLDVTQTREKINIYVFTILTLLPTALSPAISGAILVILLSFYVNYKTGFVLGIISFSYFIFQYYYDLNFTLLTKSILLFSSGLIFIALYLFSSKKLIVNEKYKWIIILLNLVLLLIYFNYSIAKKEELLKEGQLVLLELAPVDPRSLMQGDYMALRYKISENIDFTNMPKRGYCVVVLDQNDRAHKVRFQKELTPLNKNEHLIEYTASDKWNINIGAESFFFQEGKAQKYEKSKYGGIKIDKEGRSLLVGLYDEQLQIIE